MYLPPWLMITFSLFEMLYSSFETGRQPAFGGEAAKAGKQVESTASKRRKIVCRCVTRSTPLATSPRFLDRGYRMP
jgi:hypothetical protein